MQANPLFFFLLVFSLVPLVKKLDDSAVVEIGEVLLSRLVNGKEQQRDSASIALKTIFAENLTPASATKIFAFLVEKCKNVLKDSVRMKPERG